MARQAAIMQFNTNAYTIIILRWGFWGRGEGRGGGGHADLADDILACRHLMSSHALTNLAERRERQRRVHAQDVTKIHWGKARDGYCCMRPRTPLDRGAAGGCLPSLGATGGAGAASGAGLGFLCGGMGFTGQGVTGGAFLQRSATRWPSNADAAPSAIQRTRAAHVQNVSLAIHNAGHAFGKG